MWVKKQDKLPDKAGIYRVKLHSCDLRQKDTEVDMQFLPNSISGPRFLTEEIWHCVTEWWEKEED